MPEKINKITIVTPSLNQSKFFEQTIRSVLDQAGDFFIDYIVADGGSVDGSVEIIKKYGQLLVTDEYPIKCLGIEFRWWSETDRGQTQALNRGFKLAKGDICAWINSDDYYAPGAFQIIVNEYQKSPDVDLIYGQVYEMLESGEIKKGEAGPSDFLKNLQEGCQISQQSAFFTRRILQNFGYLDESFQYCMDYDLWMKILQNSKVIFIDKDLAYFRIWPGSKTKQAREKFKSEENRIRKLYGGSVFNPGTIHRLRYKLPAISFMKKNFPFLFFIGKKLIYKIINLFKYKLQKK